jgi:hypothetical protein
MLRPAPSLYNLSHCTTRQGPRPTVPAPSTSKRTEPAVVPERLVGVGGKPARLLDSSEVQDATAKWYAVKATTHPSNNRLGAFATRSHLAARLVRQQDKAAPTLMTVNAASAQK